MDSKNIFWVSLPDRFWAMTQSNPYYKFLAIPLIDELKEKLNIKNNDTWYTNINSSSIGSLKKLCLVLFFHQLVLAALFNVFTIFV